MKKTIFGILFFVITATFAQSKEGYWDNVRATKETLVLKANEKKYIKSAALPAGTTEIVFRITLLDENQQTSSSLVSLLKSIPDPTGISQGSAGAIFLLSKISGKDKCKYAVFTSLTDAENYVKTGATSTACFVQNNPINKEVKLLTQNSGCLNDKTSHLYFAFESDNWLLKENIEIEVVPWVDINKSRGWNPSTKNEVVALALNNQLAKLVSNKDQFSGYFLDLITQKYTYKEFTELIPQEKAQVITATIEKSLIKSGDKKAITTGLRNQAEVLFNSGKKQEAIDLIQNQIIEKSLATALDYNALGRFYLFTNQLNKAQEQLEKATQLDANLLISKLNLAHVYLLRNEFSKAKSIHKNYYTQNINSNTTWIKQTQSDFTELENNGLSSKNFKKYLKCLNSSVMKATYKQYFLNFKKPSGTSRGILNFKETWFIILELDGKKGIGECGLLRGLSYDDVPNYEDKLKWVCNNIHLGLDKLYKELVHFPSIQFGLEMAFLSLQADNPFVLFPSFFTNNQDVININGLIWMGKKEEMKVQIEEKLSQGFTCIKLKIGAINFNQELELLSFIRSHFNSKTIEIRVDANGAFSLNNTLDKLNQLAQYDIHSIEQPIAVNQWDEMTKLCLNSPVPIALDEELIGIYSIEKKIELLDKIKPQYLIFKPSFIGGIKGTLEWIELCEKRNINWWITSALESNIGLNAIAQFTYMQNNNLPQGLGTGALYTNNFDSPLQVKNGKLHYDPNKDWVCNLL